MAKEPYTHHVEAIFGAIKYGMSEAPSVDSFAERDFVQLTSDEEIDPDRFNRCEVSINGIKYMVSIFRPQQTDGVLDLKRPHRMIGPEDEGGKSWAVQDGKIFGWSESNCQFEEVWWLDAEGSPREDLPNQEHVKNLCRDRPFDPAWLKE